MVMKAPIYHLVTRLDISGSSYHRYALIDQTVHHFWDWWLVGTASNASWGWDMWDTANQYVSDAIGGGVLSLILFIAVLVYGFKYVGRAAKATMNKEQALFCWALGATLFSYTVAFFGISLWDQSIVEWYMLLALISAVQQYRWRKARCSNPNPSPLQTLCHALLGHRMLVVVTVGVWTARPRANSEGCLRIGSESKSFEGCRPKGSCYLKCCARWQIATSLVPLQTSFAQGGSNGLRR